jgi:hypothetical protein
VLRLRVHFLSPAIFSNALFFAKMPHSYQYASKARRTSIHTSIVELSTFLQ